MAAIIDNTYIRHRNSNVCGLSHTHTYAHTHTVSRLVKHTGFGNAAGLLMSRGLLGGGRCEGEEQYSSDSESSDTEEYQRSRDK